MNEFGAVVRYKIVPNDTRVYIAALLNDIWTIPGRTILTKCVYTDNVRVDSQIIENCFLASHPELTKPCDILQVCKY